MKAYLASVAALGMAFGAAAAAPALAEEPVTQFRTVEPQTFTSEDLQRYGLSADDAVRAVALQEQGYEIKVLSHEEAEAYMAGISATSTEWLLLGILVGVIIIAVG